MNEAKTAADSAATVPTQAPAATARGMPTSIAIALMVAISFATTSAGMAVYDRYLKTPPKFARVNVTSLVEAHEVIFSELISKAGATDDDRQRAMKLAEGLGPKLDESLKNAQRDCKCVLLVSSALIGEGYEDITPTIAKSMGLNDLDVKMARERLERQLTANARGSNPAGRSDGFLAPGPGQASALGGLAATRPQASSNN